MQSPEATAAALPEALIGALTRQVRRIPVDVDWATASLIELGLDSMAAIELVLDIEETLGVQFPDEMLVAETFATFRSLEIAVQSMIAQQ